MLLPKVIPGITPLIHLEADCIVGSKDYKLGSYQLDTGDFITLGNWTQNNTTRLISKSNLLSRILRVGVHALYKFKNGYLGISKEGVFYFEGGIIRNFFKNFKGSRPLNICVDPRDNVAYFGEYYSNKEKEEIRIFKTDNGYDWNLAWKFKPSRIRHVHGCIFDRFKEGIWVLTGDSDNESALWFTRDKFKTLEPVYKGSQKFRAVEIIPLFDGLIVPMDSPLEKNFIQYVNSIDNNIMNLCELPGSAFHAKKVGSLYFVSTVTEPSEINKVNEATLFGSLDGFKWKLISRFKKDLFPLSLQKYTRYAEITIIDGTLDTNFLIAHGRSLNIASNSTLIWKLDEIKNFLEYS